jgi:hypothetical protein
MRESRKKKGPICAKKALPEAFFHIPTTTQEGETSLLPGNLSKDLIRIS